MAMGAAYDSKMCQFECRPALPVSLFISQF